MRRSPVSAAFSLSLIGIASATLLSACGGGTAAVAAAPVVSAAGLSGTVAVGAPITNGKLRILDASGAVVASDVAIDANGQYANVALTGPGPYRIEACGYAAANYLCVYSVASAAGTANVTPLTSATVLLAAGQAPDSLMAGASTSLSSSAVEAAQNQLRTSLAGVLTSFGVSGTVDFVSAPLSAGSRAGYDGVLDAVGVTTGQDANAFVQITPRIGQGNVYLEQGHSTGTVTATDNSSLQLGELETLFRNMSASLASAEACASSATGLAHSVANNAHLSFGDEPANGPAEVGAALCAVFAGDADEGQPPSWGSTLVSPTLGRCDLSGAAPTCGVSFVIRSPAGDVQPVGHGLGVTRVGGAWKFLGSLYPIQLEATARAQRNARVDAAGTPVTFARAFAFEVEALPGLQCARVAQRDSNATLVPLAFYKRMPGATSQERLSLWSNNQTNQPSTDPATGTVRSADDTWMALPDGTDGDAVIRNFYRIGRSVTFSLYSNTACTTPFVIDGKSEFDVDVEGVPPVSAALANLPWPELDSAGQAALRNLVVPAAGTATIQAGWTFARGPLAVDEATFCVTRANCGGGSPGRIGHVDLLPSARSASAVLRNPGAAIAAGDGKSLIFSGRNGEGVGLEASFASCPQTPVGDRCL